MRTPKPQIDQIKIKETTYDINVPKSWAENDPSKVEYIKDRTHSRELLAGKDLPNAVAKYSFKNIYASGHQIYSDNWKPTESWIYAAWPCNHGDNAQVHLLDLSCSGGWYEFEFYALGTNDSQTSLLEEPIRTWINPRNSASDGSEESNEIQLIADLSQLAGSSLESWQNCQLYYNTAGFFYITGEPTVSAEKGTANSARNALYIRPVTEEPEYTQVTAEGTPLSRYRRYLSITRLDAAYLPIDGKTVLLDNNGNLTAEDVYVSGFRVTEQFGRYEPLEWVPAEGRSVKDVLDDAFCTDKLPDKINPTVELFAETAENHYEVGSEIDLDWAFRLKKGSYTYGLVNAMKESIVEKGGSEKAYSNYYATNFTTSVIQLPEPVEDEAGNVTGNIILNKFASSGDLTDDCLTPDDGIGFRTLKCNNNQNQTTIKLPAQPIIQFKLKLSLTGKLNKSYSAATMLGDISKPLVEFTTGFEGKEATDTTDAVKASPLTFTTPNILTSDYRWFWTYSDEAANENPNSETIRGYSSQLGGFPTLITTDKMKTDTLKMKMKSMCFFLPKARAKYDAAGNLETSVEVLNDATGMLAYGKMLCKEVKVNDIGKNEHDYLMYYFTNDDTDSGTNIYEVVVNDLKEEGGNS